MKLSDLPETIKAQQNFQLTGQRVHLELMRSIAKVKIAAARANLDLGLINKKVAESIIKAAEEIINGKHYEFFVTDSIQGGAGTSINMNVNEVLAARATEILGEAKIHPNDHVNLSQSTNDVLPSAFRVTCLTEIEKYLAALNSLEKAFRSKAKEFSGILKLGRTHLQDAVPLKVSSQFGAYASMIKRDVSRLRTHSQELLALNLGGTAIGTTAGGSTDFVKLAVAHFSKITGYNFSLAKDLVDATQNIDSLYALQALLKSSTIGVSKICTDLRLLASGPSGGFGEIILPEMQKGSSIMPGKANPVILEAYNQAAFQVCAAESVATQVFFHGQLELNTMQPVLMKNLLDSIVILTRATEMLYWKAITGLKLNIKNIKRNLDHSYALATYFNSEIGYEANSKLVRKSVTENVPYLQVLEESGLIENSKISQIIASAQSD